jgi:hypothetical protein
MGRQGPIGDRRVNRERQEPRLLFSEDLGNGLVPEDGMGSWESDVRKEDGQFPVA